MAWSGVPEQLYAQWRDAFRVRSHGVDLDIPCPSCGASTLHRYFQRSGARGALWEWCSSCRVYEHFSAVVPEWWSSDLDLTGLTLTAEPEALEMARTRNS